MSQNKDINGRHSNRDIQHFFGTPYWMGGGRGRAKKITSYCPLNVIDEREPPPPTSGPSPFTLFTLLLLTLFSTCSSHHLIHLIPFNIFVDVQMVNFRARNMDMETLRYQQRKDSIKQQKITSTGQNNLRGLGDGMGHWKQYLIVTALQTQVNKKKAVYQFVFCFHVCY